MRKSRSGRRVSLADIGPDGLTMFALSQLVTMASGGLTLLALWLHVRRVGRMAWVPAELDRALVLGMRLRGGKPTRDYRLRLLRACRLVRRHDQMRILILGGHTLGAPDSEARAGARFLQSKGVDIRRIDLEEGSLHTLENLREARALLTKEGNASVALITSRYHLARTLAIARGFGLSVIPCPAEPRWQGGVLVTLREAWLLHWYCTGRLFARVLSLRKTLQHIT